MNYTSIEQSKKLAEILPLESADQTWARIAIAGANLGVPEEMQYRHNGDMPFQYYSGIGIPCWSLAALLSVLPRVDIEKEICSDDTYDYRVKAYIGDGYIGDWFDNPVDACVAMIKRLHESNLL